MNGGGVIGALTDGRYLWRYLGSVRSCLSKFRDAKVEHLDAITSETVGLQPDVVGLQIAMNYALLVGLVYGRANLFQNVDCPVERQAILFSQHVAERAAVKVLHYEVSDAVRAGS